MDEIKNTITTVARNIKKTSEELFKTTKANMSISNEEMNLKSIYEDIGRKVHEIYAYGGSLGKFFDEKYAEILATERKISQLKAELELAKGSIMCPGCSNYVNKDSEFCPKCGNVMSGAKVAAKPTHLAEPAPFIPEIKEEQPPVSPPKKKCAVCGELNDAGDKFCLSCGRYL